ncbi:jg15352 [Pararge aegeria aegeria]|uniref:Jg15352 protein n=1 Tax=Pararge aegeria aegeria TaxID=348720 RepID=A0A8S4RDM2_9NEOP|nr:jg15352 [Pararge aegeria aegeria]
MNVLYLCVLVASATALPLQLVNWTFEMNPIQNFSDNMKTFFEVQKNRVEQAFNVSYQEAVRMKNSVSNYVEDQGGRISSDINNYVENIKESGRKMTDSWSYLQAEEPGAQMEIPDMSLSVPSIITRNGYTCETHTVISQGYMLNVHRIPRSKDGVETPKKTVILQHGLFASSADWILNGPDKGLAYVLANAGYDVWMPNIRGNKYSKEHAVLKSDSKSFWNFSWHDVALYDLPAVIDHVVKLKDLQSPIKALAPIASNVAYMEMLYGSHEFIPKDSVLGKMSNSCDVDNVDSLVCKNVIFYICGYNEKQFNKTLLPVFLSKLGTGTSWKTAVHFAQEITAGGRFQQFDYGKKDNLKVYGSEQPPEYDLSKITLPIKLFWAENDLLSSEKDVKLLFEKLPSTTEIYKTLPF